jgi:Fe-S-cluster formation regulator IscX/YfhJ
MPLGCLVRSFGFERYFTDEQNEDLDLSRERYTRVHLIITSLDTFDTSKDPRANASSTLLLVFSPFVDGR